MSPDLSPNPAKRKGELRLEHSAVETIAKAGLSAHAMRLLLIVLDETFGWQRTEYKAGARHWIRRSGLSRRRFYDAKKELIDAGFITSVGGFADRTTGKGDEATIQIVSSEPSVMSLRVDQKGSIPDQAQA